MTTATRKALEKVRDLLHEAGWDKTKPAQPTEISEPGIAPIREAFSALLREDDLTLLRQTLAVGQPVEDAGRALGLTPEQARTRFVEALRRSRRITRLRRERHAGRVIRFCTSARWRD